MNKHEEIGYAVVVAAKLRNDVSFSFQLNMPVGATIEAFNTEMDKLVNVIDRQAARVDVEALEHQIASHRKTLHDTGDSIKALEERLDETGPGREMVRNTGAQKVSIQQQKDTAITTYQKIEREIALAEKHLADLKKKAA